MKKLTAFILLLSALLVLCACGEKEGEYRLSVGTVLSEDLDSLTVTGTSAAVVTDRQGRIVLCRLDCAEVGATVTDKGIIGQVAEQTKAEAKESYGMKEAGGAISEWYEQAAFFEKYVTGKTIADIEGVKKGDADLSAGCTIDVTDFIRAIAAAIKSDKKLDFTPEGDMSAGLSISLSSTDSNGDVEFLYETAAAVVSEGRIAASFVDSAEATVTVENGKGKSFVYNGTKYELGMSYGMVEKGGAIAEWYEQAKSYAQSTVGKTPDSLSSLPTENVSGCTMNTEPLKAALVRAAKNIR